MKNFFRIVRYVLLYKKHVFLNIIFNILSVLFSLLSLTMIFPFLDLLFLKSEVDYEKHLNNNIGEFTLSINYLLQWLNSFLAQLIVTEGKTQALIYICIVVVIVFFFKNLCRYLGMYFLSTIRNGVVKDLRSSMYNKLLLLPLSYYTEERKGDIISRMTADVQEIETSIMGSLEMIFRDPVNILVFLIAMIVISPQLTIFVFVLLPITGLIIAGLSKSLRKNSSESKVKLGNLLSVIDETISGLRIIKGFNAEKERVARFDKENNDFTRLMVKTYRKTDLASPMSEFLGVTVLVIIMYFGGQLVLGGNSELTGSLFITYLAIFSQLIPPAKSFTTAFYSIQKGIASTERINKILDADEKIKDDINSTTISVFEREIQYNNVSFKYEKESVLNSINLVLQKGKTIALVGQSGSGKTTLADLLPRFYDCTSGQITIDGLDIKNIKLTDLRGLMGIVTQESILFNDTIFNNIAFGMPNATEEDVIAAAKIANAHEFISQMESGYQSNVGDRGSKLSGGQRQRVSIARAVFKNPPILILDEATSALDTESERLVQDALVKLMKNRTSLVIAHRLSTIQHADEIIVMQKGQIIERGTHQDLLSANGSYKKLCDLQAFV